MNIALIAHDKKKDLMIDFCISYSAILKKHNICATGTTGAVVSDATGLPIKGFFAGLVQVVSRLIQQQEGRVPQQSPGEKHLFPFSWR